MPTLYVRNFPAKVYDRIRDLAARKHRSMSAEVITLIEQGIAHDMLQERRSEALANIARRRTSYTAPPGSIDSLTLLREDRER